MEYRGYDTLVMGTCLCTFAKPHRTYYAKTEHSCKLGPWVIMICHYRFLDYHKCPTLVGMLKWGTLYIREDMGYVGNPSTPSQFCCDSKSVL